MLDERLSWNENPTLPRVDVRSLPFFAAYLEHRVRGEPKDGNPVLVCIRQVAERLTYQEEDTSRYITHLCTLVATGNSNHISPSNRPWKYISEQDFEDHVLAAAVYMDHLSDVERWGARHAYSPLFGSCFNLAIQYGSEQMVELYLRGRYVPNRCNALKFAARHGRADLIRFIFNYRIEKTPWTFDKNLRIKYEQTVLLGALSTPKPEIWDYIMEIHREYSVPIDPSLNWLSFRTACKLGRTDMVRHLVRRFGITAPRYGRLVILDVAQCGHVDIVKVLLDSGNHIPDDTVRMAASNGHTATVRLLLTYGANFTGALVAAAEGGYFDVVKLLIEHGADSNENNSRVRTLGCDSNKVNRIENPRNTNEKPLSAVAYAILAENERMLHYLLSHGASLPQGEMRDECVRRAKSRGIESMLALLDP
jgi:hypothetical protein